MPKLSEVFAGDFLKADDLKGPTTVRISKVEVKKFDDGDKLMLHFKNSDKCLICNKTNANVIAEVLGSDDTDDWEGQRITLEVRKVDFQGKRVPAIRVSDQPPVVPQAQQQPPQRPQRQAPPPAPVEPDDDMDMSGDDPDIPF